jgi:peptidylprolyl isomerase
VVAEGTGDQVVAKNSKVKVHATGTVVETDKKFWSTKDKGQQPFEYTAGVGGVIKGWDQGCLGMKLGEVRQLTIPADEGYGANGFPAWGIPPNGGLYFGARAPCRARLGHHKHMHMHMMCISCRVGVHDMHVARQTDSQCLTVVPRRAEIEVLQIK